MKVGILVPSVSRKGGGALDAVRGLAKSLLNPPEVLVEVFSLEDELTHQDIAGWNPLPVNTFKIVGPNAFGYAPDLGPALCESKLDLLHTHGSWMYPSVASLRWSRFSKKPYLISPHGMLDPWALRNSRFKKRIADWLYENTHLRGARCLHTLCESEARAMRAYGLNNPICVVPNGVDLPEGSNSDPPPWEGLVCDGGKVVLYLGRLHPKKGLRNLLLAWNVLRKKKDEVSDPWHLVIAGWGELNHENELKKLARQLDLQKTVHFVGSQFGGDKQSTYRRAQALILPSVSEGLPMVVLEAWSYGLPVLMTSYCNLPEGFENGAAIEINVDSQSIVDGLSDLMNMTDTERFEMGVQGRMLVAKKFGWSRIVAEMRAVYQWCLGGGQPPPCVTMS